MIQLGGIVAANPAACRLRPHFHGAGELPGRSGRAHRPVRRQGERRNGHGQGAALKFVVDGHSAYDDSFEIWLDPARGYLPARAVSRSHTGEAEFELLLQRADP